jgi:hypothetical protein
MTPSLTRPGQRRPQRPEERAIKKECRTLRVVAVLRTGQKGCGAPSQAGQRGAFGHNEGALCARVECCIRATYLKTGCRLCAGLLALGGSARLPIKTQVGTILAKPNYRHQKKQKEQARKLRQAEKQSRRMAARADAQGTASPEDLTVTSEPTTAGQAET